MKNHASSPLAIVLILMVTSTLCAQGPGFGRGQGQGRRAEHRDQGRAHDDRHDEDHKVFHFLLTNHNKITRKVTELADGVDTLTESSDPEIAAKIKEHVQWMEHRIENTLPIRMRDPLFAEIFKHTDKIEMQRTATKNGVRVIETSNDPYVAKLIKAHAKAVSGFVERGFAEAMKNHAVPGKQAKASPVVAPLIKQYGKVVYLPEASQQPRAGTKICVDLTRGSDPGELNPAIEKVARFVNIYRGAGKAPANAQFAIVLHSDATLAALNADAYAKVFGTKSNPNLDCLHQLHEAGVEIFVCGQTLISKGQTPADVVVFADTAVSALTTLVNLQDDGYAYVQLGK